MLGGLYGDLPPPTSAPGDDDKPAAASVWSSATKMAPPTLRKPSATFAPPTSLLRNSRPKTTTTTVQPQQPPPTTTTTFHPAALVSVQSTVLEEYDPARPNDYEDYRKDRLRRAKDAEVRKELDRRRREDEEREQREAEARRASAADQARASAAALNISGEEAWMRRAAMSGGASAQRASSPPPQADGGSGGFNIPGSSTTGLGLGAGGQLTAAQRMMAKMGWKEGQGLGKQEQGITAPLVARKTDRRAGVIVDESSSRQEKKPKSVNIEGPPTRVVLLRNMIGPGEVDDELEDEVASECSKYGTVLRVLIFEITQANFPVDEAVRIFVLFERTEESTKALVDLDKRFFGGRVVHATFFDEERFGRNELAPMPGEVAGFD
ncbi:DNA-damage-repair/toleration protein DRT111, chloroplastic [Lolium rigidum]|uniref:DNA-damage-repair/toleration protein DRT111, chloroplastic n=1 Tax=Lolium rigidum TaxID=89674 RepID=UPI001F5DC562|nr:DNA-damage-repair/toleration protein DRT111, chloroplastic [Lolium rigidum]